MWNQEVSIISGLPLNEWLWLAGFGVVLLLALYVVGQFLKIVWRD